MGQTMLKVSQAHGAFWLCSLPLLKTTPKSPCGNRGTSQLKYDKAGQIAGPALPRKTQGPRRHSPKNRYRGGVKKLLRSISTSLLALGIKPSTTGVQPKRAGAVNTIAHSVPVPERYVHCDVVIVPDNAAAAAIKYIKVQGGISS